MPLAAAPRPIVPLWAAVLTSVVSGVMLTTAFPALSWWPMAFPAVVLALIGLVLLVAARWLPETLPAERRVRGGARATVRATRELVGRRPGSVERRAELVADEGRPVDR